MTADEELAKLEDNIRRLKIEYEIYFNASSKRPPRDTVFRVESAIKRFSNEASELTISQRFKFNQLVQRYAVQNDLWRRKLREKEEGREQFSTLKEQTKTAEPGVPLEVVLSDPEAESDKVGQVVEAMMAAERQAREPSQVIDPLRIADTLLERIRQVKESTGAAAVRVSVSIEEGPSGKPRLDVVPAGQVG